MTLFRQGTRFVAALLAGLAAIAGANQSLAQSNLSAARERMLAAIAADVRETAGWTGRSVLAPEVMAAIAAVPRHAFVPASLADHAYENHPLPIGYGQTISQPFIVALMTDLLEIAPGSKVFEVGTGSGYQAAVLAEMGVTVYSIEIVAPLAREAAARLERLGYALVSVRAGDGYLGWPEAAPFDGIIVTAGADHVPPPLIEQLKPGGRMVIPVDSDHGGQELVVIEKAVDGSLAQRTVLPVLFVPLVREE